MNTNLTRKGYEYDFYQAVRMLAGPQTRFRQELEDLDATIDFGTESGSQFPTGAIREIKRSDQKNHVVINSFGISGPNGPLPDTHNDWINSENTYGKPQLKQFLELFNHRLISLLFLVKKRCLIGLHSGAPAQTEVHRYIAYVGNLVRAKSAPLPAAKRVNPDGIRGLLATEETKQQDYTGSLAPEAVNLHGFAGMLAGDRASIPRIDGIVSAYLDLPVNVRSFVGAFVAVDPDYRTKLSKNRNGRNELGTDRIIGKRVWRQDYGIGLQIGPMDYRTAVELQPGSPRYDSLVQLALYVTDSRWVIHLDLLVDTTTLPSESKFANFVKYREMGLGYSGWLKDENGDDRNDIFWIRRIVKPFSVN